MVLDSEQLEKNALVLLKKFPNAKMILKNANGKNSYQQIAKNLQLNPKTTSPALSLAKDLGFAERIEPGVYKKITSNMKYIPNKENTNKKTATIEKGFKNYKARKIRDIIKNYESEFLSEANKNIKAYVDIYVIENVLRKIIFETFGKEKKWWKEDFVSKDVFKHAEDIRLAESKHPWIKKRGDHPLYYVGLEELKKIITKHWENNFKWIGNKEKFFPWIDELIPIRNMVAHNVSLEKEEIDMTGIKSKWLITLINNQKG